jgi:hypothetical protein
MRRTSNEAREDGSTWPSSVGSQRLLSRAFIGRQRPAVRHLDESSSSACRLPRRPGRASGGPSSAWWPFEIVEQVGTPRHAWSVGQGLRGHVLCQLRLAPPCGDRPVPIPGRRCVDHGYGLGGVSTGSLAGVGASRPRPPDGGHSTDPSGNERSEGVRACGGLVWAGGFLTWSCLRCRRARALSLPGTPTRPLGGQVCGRRGTRGYTNMRAGHRRRRRAGGHRYSLSGPEVDGLNHTS